MKYVRVYVTTATHPLSMQPVHSRTTCKTISEYWSDCSANCLQACFKQEDAHVNNVFYIYTILYFHIFSQFNKHLFFLNCEKTIFIAIAAL